VPRRTPVYASRAGTVIFSHPYNPRRDRGSGYGGLVKVRHPDGSITWYAHMEGVEVQAGQPVTADTLLGYVGAEGNGSSRGPHLHYMVLDSSGDPLDPASVLGHPRRRGASAR
jgi:murein DD-endopeptidase MepM/ murein hydrolase activator NlpD